MHAPSQKILFIHILAHIFFSILFILYNLLFQHILVTNSYNKHHDHFAAGNTVKHNNAQ